MNFEHQQRKRRKQESKDQKMIGPHFVTFRHSLLFEAKCQRMSMVRCLWGLEKYYRLKFKSVICVHYSVGCKSCKLDLLCRLVYYSVSCTHYSVSCKHSLCRQVERHLSVVNIYFVGCTNYSVSHLLCQLCTLYLLSPL